MLMMRRGKLIVVKDTKETDKEVSKKEAEGCSSIQLLWKLKRLIRRLSRAEKLSSRLTANVRSRVLQRL
jgi:hypothetical protein